MRRCISTLVVGLAALAVGCSLPTDDNAQLIAEADLAPSLQDSPTTTTEPTPVAQTREFAYFLLEPKPGSEQRVVRQIVVPVQTAWSLFETVERMEVDGFKETIGADPAWINTVNQYDIVGLEVDDRVATVFLESLGSGPPDVQALRDVAAQLVWTLTGDVDVDSVLFDVDGAPQSIPTSAESVDRPVDTDDYATYNDEPTTTTTSTSSTTTTTTVPSEDASEDS